MKLKSEQGFAAVSTFVTPPRLSVWTIRGTASAVRKVVGEAWCEDDAAKGWRLAKRDGMRVRKVEIRAVG